MKKSSKEPKVSHVNLVSDEEKKTDSSDDEMEEDPEEEIEEDPEEEKVEEDSKQTLFEMIKSVRASSKKGKKIVEPSPTKENSSSKNEDEDSEEEESEEKTQEEEKEASSKKYGKGKDIAKVAAAIRAQKAEKVALRPMSKTKYFEFESLETKGWNLKKFTDPQGWTNFVSLQEHTYEDLVREFYTKENHTFNSTNLEEVPKILHNMIRHTLVPKCGSFDVVSDMDLCIIYTFMNKTKLNLCFIIIQHMIDSCLAIKQTVSRLPFGMHLTSIFQKANVTLEGEKRRLNFMKFTSKTLGQLRITTSNMSSSTTSGISESIKRPSNQNVQKTRKKRKVEETRDKSPENAEVRPPSPPALELFSQISKLAKEIVQEGSSQFKALIGE